MVARQARLFGRAVVPEWRFVGSSARGVTHARLELQNQDSFARLSPLDSLPFDSVAVADGHGGEEHFRSARGSKLAVKAVLNVFRQFMIGGASRSLTGMNRCAQEFLAWSVAHEWRRRVGEEYAFNPFSEEELERVEKGIGAEGVQDLLRDPVRAYGSTLLAVMMTKTYIIYFKLGDGAVLTVAADGTVASPVEGDERLIGSETTSLCLKEAWRDVRLSFKMRGADDPVMVVLCTDGVTNAYPGSEDLHTAARSFLEAIVRKGHSYVQAEVQALLRDLADKYTGDDATVALLYNISGVNKLRKLEKGVTDVGDAVLKVGSQDVPFWVHLSY